MGKGADTSAIEFLKALYRPLKGGLIELRAIPTIKGRDVIRHWTNKPSEIADFAVTYGTKDSQYGVYFGVCKRRVEGGKKEHVLGATTLWCDIDAEVNGIKTEAILDAVGKMPHGIQPSAVVHSGGGVHCYWFLDKAEYFEPVITQEYRDPVGTIEGGNRRLMITMGGDACWDVTRVLRLPDTYNTKRAPKLARVVYCADHLRYDARELDRAFEKWRKVLHNGQWIDPKQLPREPMQDNNDAPHWFEKVVFHGGQRLPARLDRMWEERVRDHAPRGYIGVHEATIVTAARLHCAGYDEEDIVRKVIEYQKGAPGVDSSSWNWGVEEKKIRDCLKTWGSKWTALKKRAKARGRS